MASFFSCASQNFQKIPGENWAMDKIFTEDGRFFCECAQNLTFSQSDEENSAFVFIRLLTNEYKKKSRLGALWKKLIGHYGIAPDGINYNHAEISANLRDEFVGLTAFGNNGAKFEKITEIKNHPYLYKMDGAHAICSVFALKVPQVERENVQKLLDQAIFGDDRFFFSVADLLKIPHRHKKNEKLWKKSQDFLELFPFESNPRQLELSASEFFWRNRFYCSSFVVHVLKNAVSSVRFQLYADETNHLFYTCSDILRIFGMQKLFSCTYNDYDLALQAFFERYPQFKKYF